MTDHGFFGLPARQEPASRKLDQLAASPPQVLVIEGGTVSERVAAALYYAGACNCPSGEGACGACEACIQIRDKVHMDLIFLDGAEQSILVDDIRDVRFKVGQPPRGPGRRVVILTEAQSLTPSAANALLKSMEEPRPGNCFVLLAPQRERLLPTLVSRSWVITLAWPQSGQTLDGPQAEEVAEWLEALERFWRTGQGFLGRRLAKAQPKSKARGKAAAADQQSPPAQTGLSGRVLAQAVVLALSAQLAALLAGRPDSSLGHLLASRLDMAGLRRFDILLEKSQEAMVGQVNPSLTLEWLATRVALWLR